MTEQMIISDKALPHKPLRGGAAMAAKHPQLAPATRDFAHVLQKQAAALPSGEEPVPAPAEDVPVESGTGQPPAPPADLGVRQLHIHVTVEALLAAMPAMPATPGSPPPASNGQEPIRAEGGDGKLDFPLWKGTAARSWRDMDPVPANPPEAAAAAAKTPASFTQNNDHPAVTLVAVANREPVPESRGSPVSSIVTGGNRETEPSAPREARDRKEERDTEDGPPRKEAAPSSLRSGQEKAAAEQPAVSFVAPAAQPDHTAAAPARRILDQLATPLMSAVEDIREREDAAPLRQLKIALRPDDLGTVNVTLRLRGDVLSVVIEASVPETAELLRNDHGVLDDLLKPLTGEGAVVDITILPRQADAASAPFEDAASGTSPQDSSGSRNGGALAERERSSTGKEERASQGGERTPAHETVPSAQRRLPGTLLL